MRTLAPLAALLLAGSLIAWTGASGRVSVASKGNAHTGEDSVASKDAPSSASRVTERDAPSPRLERYTAFLRDKAGPLGLLEDAELPFAVGLLRDQLLAQAYVERHRAEFLEGAEVTEAELRAAYESAKGEYVAAPSFTARHLLVYRKGNPAFPDQGASAEVARSRAETARRRLLGGESWDVVARELSDDSGTRERGGLLRERPWGLLPSQVEAALRSSQLDVPSGVIESEFGYHLVQVESRSLTPTPLPFEQVRQGISEKLGSERQLANGRRRLAPLYEATQLVRTDAGRSEAHLAARGSIAPDAVLATLGERTISEAELQAFVASTVPTSQRMLAFARPQARQKMLTSYLDVVVLSEMAERGGLEDEATFQEAFRTALEGLISTLAEERRAGGEATGSL